MKTTFSAMCSVLGHTLPFPLSDAGPTNADLMLLMSLWDVFNNVRVTVIFRDKSTALSANARVQDWYNRLVASSGEDTTKFPGIAVKNVASVAVPGADDLSLPAISMWTAKPNLEGRIYVSPEVFNGGLSGPYRFAHRVVQAEGAKDVVEPDGSLILRVDPGEVGEVFSGHFVYLDVDAP